MISTVKSANEIIISMSKSLNVESKQGNMQDVVTQVDKAVEIHLKETLFNEYVGCLKYSEWF